MNKKALGPFDGDIWLMTECDRLIRKFNPDIAIVYEKGIPFTQLWFASKMPKVINASSSIYASSSAPTRQNMGNMEVWCNIPLDEICKETNSNRPTIFYLEPAYANVDTIKKICSHSCDWIIILKGISPLPSSIDDLLDEVCPGHAYYYEPIQPEGDIRRHPIHRTCIIAPSLASMASDLYQDIGETRRSTCTEMYTTDTTPTGGPTSTIKLVHKV